MPISRSNLSIKVKCIFVIFYKNCQFYVFLFHSNMIEGQDHLKVKVKDAQYQGQLLKNQFYVLDCKCFCDLCVTRMVRL